MLDEERVEGDPVPGVDDLPETGLRLRRGPGPEDPEAVDDAVDVGIDRDRRYRVAEDEDAVRGLRADPGERGQLVERPGNHSSEALEELPGALSDRPPLDVVEAGRADQSLDRPGIRPRERRGVRVPREELGARDVRVRVPCPLGEDRSDEDLERVLGVVPEVGRAPVAGPVERREPVEDRLPEAGPRRRRRTHRNEPAPTRSRSAGAGRDAGTTDPRPGSERSGSSDARLPFRSSPTR